jgi:hypothetical protein
VRIAADWFLVAIFLLSEIVAADMEPL